MKRQTDIFVESWPIAGSFTISRGSRTEANVIRVAITQGRVTGQGECVPYARYGEDIGSVKAQIAAVVPALNEGVDREALRSALPPGAARNAVDCALWDLEAKLSGQPAWQLAGLPAPRPVTTAYTISLADPATMAEQAGRAASRELLKVKLGGDGDRERMAAVRAAAPEARIILDANEAWRPDIVQSLLDAARDIGAEMVEQPLPAGEDALLSSLHRSVPVCADESVHVGGDLASLKDRYDCVNIKLDKTGGLTEALLVRQQALDAGFSMMIGCMVGTSLAMAPAMLLTPGAQFADLDGPLLLARDRENGLDYPGSMVAPPKSALWG
ncbi:MAG: L-Ala-D/L-Glu epimerase [Nitratireductor sp.]|nr:L-Ala-D/L-Glu epimerase [Nitratireductor sp.]MCC0019811.1 L-Ala-D/L-Glu epimerase [Nitratireductor sp.]